MSDNEQQRFDTDIIKVEQLLNSGQIMPGIDMLLEMEESYSNTELKAKALFLLANVFEQVHDHQRAYMHYMEVQEKYPIPIDASICAYLRTGDLYSQMAACNLPEPFFPPIIQIEPTNACNLRCIMCPRQNMTKKVGFMDFDIFKKIVDECAANYVLALKMYFMGEPLLHKQILDFAEYALQARPLPQIMKIGIQTNGVNADLDLIKKLLEKNIYSLSFSFDAINPKKYGDIRVGAKYDEIVSTIKKTAEIKKQIGSSTVIGIAGLYMGASEEEATNFKAEWSNIVNTVEVIPITRYNNTNVLLKDGSIGPVTSPRENKSPLVCCIDGLRSLVIRWDGDVGFCCGDWDTKIILGNIRQNTLKEIWQGKALKEIHNKIRNLCYNDIPPCIECPNKYGNNDSDFLLNLKKDDGTGKQNQ